jgi:RimJ/RimL family protein N-acetyltransferase
MQQPEIRCGNLLVRPWCPEDVDEVTRACQDPEILRWTPLPRPYRTEHAVDFITRTAPAAWDDATGAHFGVFDADTGRLLGSSGLPRMDLTAHQAEIGYWTAPWARGRGIATVAGRAICLWAHDHLQIDRLIWRADLGNHASRLVARRLGFTMEGVQRGGLPATDGSGRRVDVWIASVRPGEVTSVTPPSLGPGSPAAVRVATFAEPQPTPSLGGSRQTGDSQTGDSQTVGRLRACAERDIDATTRACQDPETVRWTTVPEGYRREDAETFALTYAPRVWRVGEGAVFVIADPDDAYCGGIDLRLSEDDGVAEIGFQVAPWARGKGLGTAAVRTICAWGFDALHLDRIVWRAHVGNDGSRRVAEKAGFTMEGVQRRGCLQRGERRDAWVASLLSTDPR